MNIFSGELKNRKIIAPEGLETRPTSGRMRQTLFNICQTIIEDSVFLDLFAGSGAMGLEAISRGASQVTFIDHSPEAVRCIKENIESMGVKDKAVVICADIVKTLEKLEKSAKQFDIIFADPPYEHEEALGFKVLQILDGSQLIKTGGWVFLEESAKVILPTKELTRLKLQSYRKTGRSSLYEFMVL